jgi:hypothetical protein
MRCNRANPADAKFCGECGAGLLRRFCGACDAVNDAESHFCQACGHVLPEQLAPTPPSRSPTKAVPDLTDEVLIGPIQSYQPIAVAPRLDASALAQVPAHVPVLAVDAARARKNQHKPAYRIPMLLAVGGATSLAMAVWIWPRMEPSGPPMRRPVTVPVAAAVEAVPLLATEPAYGAAAAPDAVARADAALARANAALERANAAAAAAEQPAARIKEAGQVETRRSPIERAQMAQRQVVDPAATQRAPVQRAPPKPATPPPECTPHVDALGLCAPGATITGR